MERLLGKQIVAEFIFIDGESVHLRDSLQKINGSSGNGYFLTEYGIQLSLKYSKPRGYDQWISVTVPEGSDIEKKLKNLGIIK